MAGTRIERDPTRDIAPEASVIEAALPATLTADERTAAVDRALAAWQTHHDGLVAAWQAQVDADAAEARDREEAAAAEQLRLEEARLAALKEAEDAERAAQEAKRPKFSVDNDAVAPVTTEFQVGPTTREDLRKGKWVAWHLFTPELCREEMNSYQLEAVYTLVPGDDGNVVMRSSRRGTKTTVLPDRRLSFEQWSSGIPIYLRTIKDVGWPPLVVEQWNTMLFKLQHHNARFQDPRAVVLYSAQLRDDWHRDFTDGKVLFNVSHICETRVTNALLASKMQDFDSAIAEAKATASALRAPTQSTSKSSTRPEPYTKGGAHFQTDAANAGHSACVICLGRHTHNVATCTSDTLHGTTKKAATTRRGGVLTNITNNTAVCLRYNVRGACNAMGAGHNGAHDCSGCGKAGHSAQACTALRA
ncbi:hypothetical protein EXIGLDRAFT_783169 [Exidia glandulosa HHB12029]|uniref:Uncharacterized protein n=1 Tax=Exidia glandulosa HHB12029 TaxID=1314781 RepID=A0A166N7J8_EXIGL|nr:hypothetical protein EXIGLDRAFT_783169 [Exidia glandulosa HHB12029]